MIFLLFWQFAQAPAATWTEKPVPHWTCPAAGYMLNNAQQTPVCGRRTKHNQEQMKVDLTTEEYIFWKWTRKINADGKLDLAYPQEIRNPGCSIVSTDKDFKGKPGQSVNLDCYGIVKR
jgi:hypothetical protein